MFTKAIRLTQTVKGSGCAAKLAPGVLEKALCGLNLPVNPQLLVGLEHADDAGVYKVTDELALVQTVDFFPPMVDDPFSFGQIAAANALSDIYAMGGSPKTAMNIVAFPSKTLDVSILRSIIEGGLDKMLEAGVVLVGGHSVEDSELKYGLSVTGYIHPDRILTKKNIHAGDCMVLTKSIGTGIVTTAIKAGLAGKKLTDEIVQSMATLNMKAAAIMLNFDVHACTDITGFGFLGHLAEMVVDSGCGVRINSASVPIIAEALEWAAMGLIPAGAYSNRTFSDGWVDFSYNVNQNVQDVLYDPQTSGGLLIAVTARDAEQLVSELKDNGVNCAAIVGEVVANPANRIIVE
jgi:selenide,water dikinase